MIYISWIISILSRLWLHGPMVRSGKRVAQAVVWKPPGPRQPQPRAAAHHHQPHDPALSERRRPRRDDLRSAGTSGGSIMGIIMMNIDMILMDDSD